MAAPMCRSRTEDFLQMRRRMKGSQRRPPPRLSNAYDAVPNDSVSVRVRDCCMPEWVDHLDEIREMEEQIKQSLTQLDELHKRKLRPTSLFNAEQDDKDKVEAQLVTARLSSQFKKIQAEVKRLDLLASRTTSPEDKKAIDNIRTASAAQVGALSRQFKEMQKEFLNAEKDRQRKTLIPESEEARRWEREDAMEKKEEAMQLSRLSADQQEMLRLNEELVSQRDTELQDIVKSLVDIHEMFQDFNALVIEQGTMLDRIDYNVNQAYDSVTRGVKELSQAETSAKSSRFKLCVMLLLFLILLFIIALAMRKK